MDNNMQELIKEFKKIKSRGYITSFYKYKNSAGLTFEKLLGKECDELFWPDYHGIEIKTKQGYSKSRISLFTAVPDGKYLYPIKYLYDNYSWINDGERSFFLEVKASECTFQKKFIFALDVDWNNKWVSLNIYDRKFHLIDNSVVWSFSLLKERLDLKLKKLALVKCWTKRGNEFEQYLYYKITFYKDIIFDKFLEQIINGNISVKFTIDTFKKGKRCGQVHNHGTIFAIEEKALKNIYERKYEVW